MLEAAIRQTQILQYQVGGMVAFVEAENKEKLLSFYENYGFKRFATFSFIRAVHCGLPFVMQNGGNLWQIIKQRNKKYRNLQTTFKGMEKSLDRESERKIPGMSHGSKN